MRALVDDDNLEKQTSIMEGKRGLGQFSLRPRRKWHRGGRGAKKKASIDNHCRWAISCLILSAAAIKWKIHFNRIHLLNFRSASKKAIKIIRSNGGVVWRWWEEMAFDLILMALTIISFNSQFDIRHTGAIAIGWREKEESEWEPMNKRWMLSK